MSYAGIYRTQEEDVELFNALLEQLKNRELDQSVLNYLKRAVSSGLDIQTCLEDLANSRISGSDPIQVASRTRELLETYVLL